MVINMTLLFFFQEIWQVGIIVTTMIFCKRYNSIKFSNYFLNSMFTIDIIICKRIKSQKTSQIIVAELPYD